ncbi:hypothetical protein F444_08880 [Phytophthora nicotianae P1976]|uniref:PiggyBac transposable element-derived protein domain-containing protein n=1 Tax=Phytophthora nicotianae P1976 TaxID=1317066 RepID=A0A081A9L4_PHYNI|nr:hypothetical protein F444_08880 [Phytophthora nicotianae P1976]
MKDYHTFMGGVDVHDQLRLQRYSLQLAIKYKKYYNSLFLGLIDLVIVNAYITHNAARAAAGLQKLSHVKFMKQLHLELCQLREEDWDALLRDDGQATPTQSPAAGSGRRAIHLPLKNEKMRPGNDGKGQKRCVRACKVCSWMKGISGTTANDTSTYCSFCKLKVKGKTLQNNPQAQRVFLCDKVRHTHNGAAMSCFELWHKGWRNGTRRPASKSKLRARTPVEVCEEEVQSSSDESSGEHQAKRARQNS